MAGISLIDSRRRILLNAPHIETASGDIATFSTDMHSPLRSLRIGIDPVQDLHGYENPWPAGGGVNKLPPAASYLPVTNGDLTVTPYADGHYHIKKVAGSASNIQINLLQTINITTTLYYTPIASVAGTGAMTCNLVTAESSTLTSAYVGKTSSLCTGNGTAERISFYFTASSEYEGDLFPMITEAVATTFAPYSNICPISGWSAAKLWKTGKNLLPLRIYTGIPYNSSVGGTLNPSPTSRSWTQNANSISYTSSSAYTVMSLMTGLLPPGTYRFTIKKLSTYTIRFTRYWLNRDFVIQGKSYETNVSESTYTYTLTDYGYIAISLDSGSGNSSRTHEIQIQVEIGSGTEYAPYTGNTYPITIPTPPGTVYGGYISVGADGSAELVVDRAMFDLGQASINYLDDYDYPYFSVTMPSDSVRGYDHIGEISVWASIYKAIENIAASTFRQHNYNYCCCLNTAVSTKKLIIQDPRYTDAEIYKTAMSGVQVVYELDTPITIPLTPQQISTLKGVNNIWADCGPVNIKYWTHK